MPASPDFRASYQHFSSIALSLALDFLLWQMQPVYGISEVLASILQESPAEQRMPPNVCLHRSVKTIETHKVTVRALVKQNKNGVETCNGTTMMLV